MAAVRLCLLGAGRWGQRYIETIRAMHGVKLAAVASRNAGIAALLPESCCVFTNWNDAISADDIDAVVIATPPNIHCEMALAVIKRGIPVLVEKPLALSVDEALQIEAMSAHRNVPVMVGHIHLHNPGYLALKRHLPAIGRIKGLYMRAGNQGPFRPDVTPLWDWAPHDLSICLDLLGVSPRSIAIERMAEERRNSGWAGNYHLRLGFPGEITADILVGNMMGGKYRSLKVEGSAGSLIFDDVAGSLDFAKGENREVLSFGGEKPLTRQLKKFSILARGHGPADLSLHHGRIITQILASYISQD